MARLHFASEVEGQGRAGATLSALPSPGTPLFSCSSFLPGDLLRSADAAMHEAKRRGKARHTVYEESMGTRATERLQLESAYWGLSSSRCLRCINSPRCRSRAARMA